MVNARTGVSEKLGRLYTMRGKKATEVKELGCGDIGAIGKMEKVKTGDTLCDARKVVALKELPFAEPCYSVAIVPKTRGQEDKIAQGLARMNEEDPTFSVTNNAETHQMVLNGSGDIQVDVLVSKLKSRFNVEADLKPVRVPYREKIRKTVQKQGRHKKQTGGSGQFGDVWIRFEPLLSEDDMIFAEEVFGGSVPKNFFPAVEKGLREACAHGLLAGYPVVNLKAVLYDGSYHPVDSSEIAFKTAAQLAYKGRPAGGQPGPAGAGGRAEGHCARQLHGRRHRRSEQEVRKRQSASLRRESGVQVFCRRQNLEIGRIHFGRFASNAGSPQGAKRLAGRLPACGPGEGHRGGEGAPGGGGKITHICKNQNGGEQTPPPFL